MDSKEFAWERLSTHNLTHPTPKRRNFVLVNLQAGIPFTQSIHTDWVRNILWSTTSKGADRWNAINRMSNYPSLSKSPSTTKKQTRFYLTLNTLHWKLSTSDDQNISFRDYLIPFKGRTQKVHERSIKKGCSDTIIDVVNTQIIPYTMKYTTHFADIIW